MKMKELKIEVFGRVQGVRFRHFVKENADNLGINGYVMNRADGSVLTVAQGQKDKLELFLNALQKGPAFSKVEGVSYFWKDVNSKYDNFVITIDKGMIEDQKSSLRNLGKKIFGIKDKVPTHIAIIPDGNRRWAKERGMLSSLGHKEGISFERMKSLFEEARSRGIKYLTLWFFSTENWNRGKTEIDYLFKLFSEISAQFKDYAIKNKIRFRHFGRKDRIPKEIMDIMERTQKATEKFHEFNVQICMDYGGRDEMARAINKMLNAGVNEIKEEDIKNYLDSAEIPDPDLVIRTAGEKRLSGLMPFQATYAELYFTDIYFPDFGVEELRKSIEEYSRRTRSFGGNR